MMSDLRYLYNARVTNVYDGDTITVDLDLGLGVWVKDQRLRLYGIDTPEVRGEERAQGLVARDWLRAKALGRAVTVETIKDRTGKYGRWLAILWVKGENINETLIADGMARRYMVD